MREKDFQTKFSKWLRYNLHISIAYELKVAKGRSLPFNAVAGHQLEALLNAANSSIAYKLPDDTIGQKPFDGFKLVGVSAYVGILFDTGKPTNEFYLIRIEEFLKEAQASDRKSLTDVRANQIGSCCHFNEMVR